MTQKTVRVVSAEERERILHSPSRHRAFQYAIMSVWTSSDLREAVAHSFPDSKSMIDFIVAEGLIEDELDDYFDFFAYPDHEAALVKAGLLAPWIPPEDRPDWPPEPTVLAADMQGQPKLIDP